jgi:hypothetical protein
MSKKLIQAAAGAGGESVYVEDVFSTYLYDGNDSATSVNNGLDLSGEGGLVWIKRRNGANVHSLFDSETSSGGRYYLASNLSNALLDTGTTSVPFTSTGFTANGASFQWNNSAGEYTSWSFRQQAGFFSIITWSGDGTTGRSIPHNLGSTPGCVIVKAYNQGQNWGVLARKSDGTWAYGGATYAFGLNTNEPALSRSSISTDATNFYPEDLRTGVNWNASGYNYIAYLFAHDDQSFGDNSDESIIKCGSFTTDGSGLADVNLGWEPQWILVKPTNVSSFNWYMNDSMRPWPTDNGTIYGNNLYANLSNAEGSGDGRFYPTSTGFSVYPSQGIGTGTTCIYIAIRRPMKTPEAGTEVFTPNAYTGNGATRVLTSSNDPVDLGIVRGRGGSADWIWSDRLRGATKTLYSNYTQAEDTQSTYITGFDVQDGMEVGTGTAVNGSGSTYISYMLSRATGFFDVVAYTGDGALSQSINHNLGVTPEMMIVKRRESASDWICYHSGNTAAPETEMLKLNTTDATTDFDDAWRDTAPTSSVFTVGSWSYVNASGGSYIAYLFVTLAGVSKVGSYTGTGSDQNIDCGFSGSPRFLMIKRTDSAGDWYVWDSARGIVAGNDPRLQINSGSGGETTSQDWIDPYASGFTLVGGNQPNISGGTYIFLAIA